MLNIPRTKNEEPVHVPLNDSAAAALRVVHNLGDGRGCVFQSAKPGDPPENGRYWFDDEVMEAGGQELSLARLATHLCKPAANERCSS